MGSEFVATRGFEDRFVEWLNIHGQEIGMLYGTRRDIPFDNFDTTIVDPEEQNWVEWKVARLACILLTASPFATVGDRVLSWADHCFDLIEHLLYP